eukprot:scaffold75958_cov45-Phaeocystis_antarctica.AAC.1
MLEGGEIGELEGSSLEHPRQWLGSQWAGLFLGAPSRPEPPGAPRGGTGAELGRCEGGTLTMLRHGRLGPIGAGVHDGDVVEHDAVD